MTRSKSKTLGLVARVSRVGGREGERFISPGEQVKEGTRVAEKFGYSVATFLKDPEGAGVPGSVPFDKRPGMSAALAAVESGKLAGIVVATLDRLVREDPEKGVTLKSFQARIRKAGGILIVCDSPDASIEDPDTEELTGNASVGIKARLMMDSVYREEAGKRWRTARRNAVEAGRYVGPTPAGYDRGEDGKLVPGEYAPAILRAFELRASGASWSKVAKSLTDAGVETKSGSTRWSLKAASKLIENEAYLGVAKSGEFENRHAHDGIVGPSLFRKANARKETRSVTRGDKAPALLAGFLKCSKCGHRLTADPVKRHGKTYMYYRCRNVGACEGGVGVGGKMAETFIVDAALAHVGTVWSTKAEGSEELAGALERLEAAKAEVASVEEMIGTKLPESSVQVAALHAAEDAVEIARGGGRMTRWFIPHEDDTGAFGFEGVTAKELGVETTRTRFESLAVETKREALMSLIETATVAPGKGSVEDRIEIEFKLAA